MSCAVVVLLNRYVGISGITGILGNLDHGHQFLKVGSDIREGGVERWGEH
jgi:hypothetical protein